jgi:nitroreductase
MTDLFDVIRDRQSVRKFQPTDVPAEQLATVLEAMNRAPSAGNLQAYEVVVVRSKERRDLLAKVAHDQVYVAEAPVVLVFLHDPAKSATSYAARGDLYACQDATIAAAYAQLAAHALGLATLWVGSFEDEAVCKIVNARPGLHPCAFILIGHAAETPEKTTRRPLGELVHQERFGRSP